ncbi:MAG: hypothetical protein AAGA03_02930 [Planctomycetota bacterium]
MRNLTLGVLILTLGVLAAIPFRRARRVDDAPIEPGQATGPRASNLPTSLGVDDAATRASELPRLTSPHPQSRSIATHPKHANARQTSTSASSILDRHRWSQDAAGTPLTYRDLAIPVDQPPGVQQDFAAASQFQSVAERVETTAPRFSPEAFVQQSLQLRGPAIAPMQRPSTADQLATRSLARPSRGAPAAAAQTVNSQPSDSDGVPSQTISHEPAGSQSILIPESLPKPAGRERLWIRQPSF